MVSAILSLLALAATSASALKVTSPTSSDVWTAGDAQTVTWETVSSDQDTFNIYLSNMASYPSTTILLASDVSADAGSADIDGSKLTTGTAFTINFTNGTETEQIYAQSVSYLSLSLSLVETRADCQSDAGWVHLYPESHAHIKDTKKKGTIICM